MRLSPKIIIQCNQCGEAGWFDMTPLARKSWGDRSVTSQAERSGWEVNEDEDHDLCPRCVKKNARQVASAGKGKKK